MSGVAIGSNKIIWEEQQSLSVASQTMVSIIFFNAFHYADDKNRPADIASGIEMSITYIIQSEFIRCDWLDPFYQMKMMRMWIKSILLLHIYTISNFICCCNMFWLKLQVQSGNPTMERTETIWKCDNKMACIISIDTTCLNENVACPCFFPRWSSRDEHVQSNLASISFVYVVRKCMHWLDQFPMVTAIVMVIET